MLSCNGRMTMMALDIVRLSWRKEGISLKTSFRRKLTLWRKKSHHDASHTKSSLNITVSRPNEMHLMRWVKQTIHIFIPMNNNLIINLFVAFWSSSCYLRSCPFYTCCVCDEVLCIRMWNIQAHLFITHTPQPHDWLLSWFS